MRNKTIHLMIVAFLSLGILLMTAAVGGQKLTGTTAQNTAYTITDLGTLGGNNSAPSWITNSGDVIGTSETGQFDTFGNAIVHAFQWQGGVMEDLETLGDIDSAGLGGNNRGVTVGYNSYNINHALLWYQGAATDLGTLVGPSGQSQAQLVNNEGQAVGTSQAADGTIHAVVWSHGAISDLGTLGGPGSSTSSIGNGINDVGQIVGDSQEDTISNPLLGFPPFFPTLWDKGSATKLGGEPSYAFAGDAFSINNKGQVVGRIAVADAKERAVGHAYFWEAGVMRDLGVPAGDDNSEANSLNELGQIVGDAGVGFIFYSPDRALLWQNGEMFDLNTLIAPDSGYYLIKAFDVNARGQIAVCAVQQSTGDVHAALLTPQPSNVAGNAVPSTGGVSRPAPSLSERARRLLNMERGRKLGLTARPND
jgi:probable HAF family extracellular repeat protein